MSQYLCYGDYICLYCEETKGYMYSEQSSATMDGLFVYADQDRNQPSGIPNVHAVTFQVYTMLRYKQTKKYRELVKKYGLNPSDEQLNKQVQDAKKMAVVEMADNMAEQARLLGKPFYYGQVIQLLHVFTNKFMHMSSDDTSVIDKSKMMVSLKSFSSKSAQFKIQPRYKIKVEGEYIEVHDQIVLENVKSQDNFLHASDPYQLDSFTRGSELNAGVEMASLTLLIHYRHEKQNQCYLKGGDVIRMFHKDLQAYLVAEGGFRVPPEEGVHLRIRLEDPNDPRTLQRPKSGITYWQLELASSILKGDVIRWETSVRFRHMTTRRYLAFSETSEIYLTDDGLDAKTVFKMYSMSQVLDGDMITIDSNVRIQHVVTNCWLHASIGVPYKKHASGGDRMWDDAELLQVAAHNSRQYQDAFTLQKVPEKEWRNFNYIAGILPFIEDLIVKRRKPGNLLTAMRSVSIQKTLTDLSIFLEDEAGKDEARQKLLRHLGMIDTIVRLLKVPVDADSKDIVHLHEVFCHFYKVLLTYARARNEKNALYAARYLSFFIKQLPVPGEVGLECCKMVIALIRDHRRIVDRISPDTIKFIIKILLTRQHHLYLDLLGVLSVCDNIGMTENQTLIAEHLLVKQKETLFHIQLGQDIGHTVDTMYVSTDKRKTWTTLHTMPYIGNIDYDERKYLFFTHQLDLFKLLCYGNNERAVNIITRNREYVPWEVAYLGLVSEVLPYSMRCKFCDLLVGLFIEVTDNTAIVSAMSNNFVYDEIDVGSYGQSAADTVPHDMEANFPPLRVWLRQFLSGTNTLVSAEAGKNILIKEVLRLITALIRYGFMGSRSECEEIMKIVHELLDSSTDIPFLLGKNRIPNKWELQMIEEWKGTNRYEKSQETDAIIEIKIQGLEIIEILLMKEFNRRVRYFVAVFKKIHLTEDLARAKRKLLVKLLPDDFDMKNLWRSKKIRKKIDKFLEKMYKETEIVDPTLPTMLFELTKYPSDILNTKVLSILNQFYASKLKLFHATQRTHALVTTEAVRVHREALHGMVILNRLTQSKINERIGKEVCRILDTFAKLCYVQHGENPPHRIGQNILVNNGILQLLIPLVTQDVDKNSRESLAISNKVIGSGLEVLRYLAKKNQYVQSYLMDRLEALLSVQCCGEHQALALIEIFHDHTVHCLRLQGHQVQKMVKLAGRYRQKAPSFLTLLRAIIKIERSDTLLKRNQHLVTKYVMESYKTAAYPMRLSVSKRLRILIGKDGEAHQTYLIFLLDLLATCAEGENRYIESLCQTLLTVPELINILNNRHVLMEKKIGFARYLVWAYMKTARNVIESGVEELHHNPDIWKHFKILLTLMNSENAKPPNPMPQTSELTHQKLEREGSRITGLFTAGNSIATAPLLAVEPDGPDSHSFKIYMIHAGFALLQTFFSRFFKMDPDKYPEEIDVLKKLAVSLVKFTYCCSMDINLSSNLGIMVECVETLGQTMKLSKTGLEKMCREANLKLTVAAIKSRIEVSYRETSNKEMEMNTKMHNFAKALATYLENQNTLSAQLLIRGRRANEQYVPDELEVKIPLGREFQVHVRSFNLAGDNYRIHSIINHLEISSLNVKNSNFRPEEGLDIRCIQILRTLIYNKCICLPEDTSSKLYKRILGEIKDMQKKLLDYNIVSKVLPLLNRSVPVAMEVLSLVDLMLCHCNRDMQKTLIKYFTTAADNIFFLFMKDRIHVARLALKERRSMKSQSEAKKLDIARKKKEKSEEENIKAQEREKIKYDKKALRRKGLRPFFDKLRANRLLLIEDWREKKKDIELNLGLLDEYDNNDEEDESEQQISVGTYQDGSDVVLIFRTMGRLCDGQYQPLQDYLRHQDSLQSVNLVAEMTSFFGGMYTHINSETIDLASQVINAIMEMCMGNQENRAVVLNNKIIDYANFILRLPSFEGCEIEQVVELKMELVGLIIALIEENGPGAALIAREVGVTLDQAVIREHLYVAYKVAHLGDHDLGKLILGMPNYVKKRPSKQIKEYINVLGFKFYYILARIFDINPKLAKEGFENSRERIAFHHYKNQCRSVEVIKDDYLQRVHFRVKNPGLLREEVIEEVKWNVDRTSSSNKLRDLLLWGKDILKDVKYQKKILSNPILKQMAKHWFLLTTFKVHQIFLLTMPMLAMSVVALLYILCTINGAIWGYAIIFLSIAINLLMLLTWDAPGDLSDFPANITTLPSVVLSHTPSITWEYYHIIMLVLNVCHNVSSLMLLASYLLLKHPQLPRLSSLKNCFKSCRKKKEEDTGTEQKDLVVKERNEPASRLQESLLSGTTVYYILLAACSFLGTVYEVYFFSFHLVNIVSSNELLKGVIKAVTQNGKSLLWVGIMGIVIIYLYALVAFAFLRASYQADNEMYCQTLAQCFVTTLRYGVIGDITENLRLNALTENFRNFAFLTIYQLSFFILFTTIGLNVIFGIIVDTFSELRDLKWTAEKDMHERCFICSRDSYDFETENANADNEFNDGFEKHTKKDHNMWSYVFYMLHLVETEEEDCGSIDLLVKKMVQQDVLDFFPLNRALCLAQTEEDAEDQKIDGVVAALGTIYKRQQQEEQTKRRDIERRQQRAWQAEFWNTGETSLESMHHRASIELDNISLTDSII